MSVPRTDGISRYAGYCCDPGFPVAAYLVRPKAQYHTRYFSLVSPTVLRVRGYRLYFFSREEARLHVHVQHATGEAKFWLDPEIALAANYGLTASRLAAAQRIIKEHEDEIRSAWKAHFGR